MSIEVPHTPGDSIIRELALNLYASPLESFREAITNAQDENSPKVVITVKHDEVVVEDWGNGIENIETFTKYGQSSKKDREDPEVVGEKGIGKLALLRLANQTDGAVYFKSNNGRFGMNIIMKPTKINYDIGAAAEFLDHKGTKIIIPKPDEVPSDDELIKYLRDVLGLRIARGHKIEVNGINITPKATLNPQERLIVRLEGGIDVNGNIYSDERGHGAIDVYVKHVYVATVVVDPERSFSGWVNCNALKVTTNRGDIVKDKLIYKSFIEHLTQFAAKFPKREQVMSRSEVLVSNQMAEMLKNFIKDFDIKIEGRLSMLPPIAENTYEVQRQHIPALPPGGTPTPTPVPETHVQTRQDKPPGTPKVKRQVNTTYGIRWIDVDVGNSKPPIYFEAPNVMVRNVSHELYKFAMKDGQTLGPKWLRLLPYLSRAAVKLSENAPQWSKEEFEAQTDKTMLYFLKQQGMMG